MNILVFTTLYPNAAQPNHGIFVENRVRELRRHTGWHFRVVAPVPWFPFRGARWGAWSQFARVPRVEERDGIVVHHPRYLVIPALSWRVAPLFIALAAYGLLRRLHQESPVELVDAHFLFPDGAAAVMLARRLGVPVFMTARGSDVNDSPRHRLPRLFLRRALRRATRTLAVSRELGRKLTALEPVIGEVPVAMNGVDTKRFRPMDKARSRARYGLAGKVVLSVASLRRLKGHDLLIRAIRGLDGFTLVIAGEGAERGQLEVLARQEGVADRVRFLGAVPNAELPELYSAADVFALASESEGCPNVILEAMACGLPIVATPVGAIPELVPESGRALLVPTRTAEAFQTCLASALAGEQGADASLDRAAELGWPEVSGLLARLMQEGVACAANNAAPPQQRELPTGSGGRS